MGVGAARRGLLPAALLLLGLTTGAALAEPQLWKVSDADSHVWLFGSIHMLDEARDWRSATFDAALDDSELVYFEVILDAEAYSTMTQLTFAEGMNRDGRTLDDYLTVDQRAILRDAAEANGIDYAILKRMRPWLAELTLVQQSGFGMEMRSGAAGVETIIAEEIADDRERELETPEFQFRLLTGRSDEEQVASLMLTAAGLSRQAGLLTGMVEAWLAGDADGLHAAMTSEMGSIEDPFYRRLITDRNRDWVGHIAGMLDRNESAIVIVGAGHLVGPVAVQTLLAEEGYAISLESAPPRGDAPRPVRPR